MPRVAEHGHQVPSSNERDFRVNLALDVCKKTDPNSVTFTGWATCCTDDAGNPVIDHDGQIIPVAVLEKAVHKAATESSGKGRGGDMHTRKGVLDVLESMVVTAEKRAALGFGEGREGWVITARSTDPEVVKAVKSGDKLELSIFGTGKAVQADSADQMHAILSGVSDA